MAEHKLNGEDWILKIDTAGGTSYETVVCLKSFKFNSQNAEVDASSFCGQEKRPGIEAETVDIEAINLYDASTGKVSGPDLYATKQAKTKIGCSITRATPVTGDPVKVFQAYIMNYSEDYSHNSVAAWTAQLAVSGSVTQTITT
jgi:hypothetical protein